MPRYPRLHRPGDTLHVISRFVNRAFRLDGHSARRKYLTCLTDALAATDWRLLNYVLMSSHVHHTVVAGESELASLLRPAHSRFASWVNRRDGTSGPVFMERAKSLRLAGRIDRTIAYVHNNPVRAGVVAHAAASDWSSHRAYVGLDPAPPWLAVEEGLARAGFDGTECGRKAFGEYVDARAGDPRDASLSAGDADRTRARARAAAGGPVELGTPTFDGGRSIWSVVGRDGLVLRPVWAGDLQRLVGLAGRVCGIDPQIRRSRAASAARQLVVRVACLELNRSLTEASGALGLSVSRGRELLKAARGNDALTEHARVLADALWQLER